MPTPNFCSHASVLEQVAANLHVNAADLPSQWLNICSHAARRAAAELRSILVLKGYSPTEIASWSDAFTYSQQLGAYFALTAGAALANYDTKTIEWMDCRKEMRESQAIIIGDVAVAPTGNSDVGGISSGTLSAVQEITDDMTDKGWFS